MKITITYTNLSTRKGKNKITFSNADSVKDFYKNNKIFIDAFFIKFGFYENAGGEGINAGADMFEILEQRNLISKEK